jgi:MotA/TolQ/ExbB proton channel family
MAKMRGVPQVRDARILVNGIIGPERCAVIILAVYFTLRLIQRSLARRKHERARIEIMNSLLSMPEESKWLPLTARIASTRPVLSKLKRLETTIPYIILKAAFDQMEARADASVAEGKPSNDYVGIRASQERQELDGSRTVLDILLPTFPAIGFIGTVRSLLIAMSQADKIVSTTDPFAKGLAASQVTDILSLCFSTTFLALCAVLVFSPLSLLQQSREHRLVDDVYRLIEIVLRPNQ